MYSYLKNVSIFSFTNGFDNLFVFAAKAGRLQNSHVSVPSLAVSVSHHG